MNFPRLLVALTAPMLLVACVLIPGAFESEMTLDRDGDFTFTYVGEIHVGPDDAARDMAPPDAGGGRPEHLDAEMNRGFADFMRQMMGGLDPRDEEQVRAFAERLEAREGWNSVEYRGDGVFDVDYEVQGNLTHDFAFPIVPDFLLNFPMVAAVPRDDGTALVKVPALMRPPGDDSEGDRPGHGSFVLRTDAPIVSNNAANEARGQDGRTILRWDSDREREEAPQAIIQLELGA